MSNTRLPLKGDDTWFYVGLTSSFIDLNHSADTSAPNQKLQLSRPTLCTSANTSTASTTKDTDPDSSQTTSQSQPQSQPQFQPQFQPQSQRPSAFKVFEIPSLSSSPTQPTELTAEAAITTVSLTEQVLIFRHRDQFHAIDHRCPHRAYPLLKGSVYDIEDFGVVFSAGIVCPKHGWAFDLHTGEADRGPYRLRVWEVELRDGDGIGEREREREVWVKGRKMKRIG